jgi:hypothetical protein
VDKSAHYWTIDGIAIEADIVIATPVEWDASPHSGEREWSVVRCGCRVVASRFLLPDVLLSLLSRRRASAYEFPEAIYKAK